MITAFMLYDLRRSLRVLGLLWLAVTGFVLFQPGPLQGGLPGTFHLLGMLTGTFLAARLMSDLGGTQAYVCSRGLTRRRLLLMRTCLGIASIGMLGIWIWLMISLGFREQTHAMLKMRDVVFYPMSTRFESSIVIPFLFTGIGAFEVTMFYMAWRGLCFPSWNSTVSGIARLILVEFPLGALLLASSALARFVPVMDGQIEDSSMMNTMLWLLWLPAGYSVIAFVGSWFVARDLEVG